MEENIAGALGDRFPGRRDRRALIWRAWKSFARALFETGALIHWSKERVIKKVRVEGEEHLQQALELRRGVLALSAIWEISLSSAPAWPPPGTRLASS